MRRAFLSAAAVLSFASATAAADIEILRSPTCECCERWAVYLDKKGFKTKIRDLMPANLSQIKQQAGITPALRSCHTAFIEGYVIEGHVPAEDIDRLLAEKPDAVGLSVPGMPIGSPGMEQGSEKQAYDVLLVKKDGTTEVFAHHE